MNRGVFRLVALDEGAVRGTSDNLRLVCVTDRDEKVAIWGKEGGRRNIDTVLKAGIPCVVDTEWREPGEVQARKFSHRYWVREDCRLSVVEPATRAHPGDQWSGLSEPGIVYPEETFETAVFEVVRAGLSTAGAPYRLIPHFNSDISP